MDGVGVGDQGGDVLLNVPKGILKLLTVDGATGAAVSVFVLLYQ